MDYNVKNGYKNKVSAMIHDTSINGLNIDKLIDDVSNVPAVNYMYRVLSGMPNVDVGDVVNNAMNNAILMKDESVSIISNVCRWISVIDKSFIKVGKLAIGKAINDVGKGFKPNLIECLKCEIGDKVLDEPAMIDTYNRVYDKHYKTIKAITTHDNDFLTNILIDIEGEGKQAKKKFKLMH